MRPSVPSGNIGDYAACYNGTGNGSGNTSVKFYGNTKKVGNSLTPISSATDGASIVVNVRGKYFITVTDITSGAPDAGAISINSISAPTSGSEYNPNGQLVYKDFVVSNVHETFCVVADLDRGDVIRFVVSTLDFGTGNNIDGMTAVRIA